MTCCYSCCGPCDPEDKEKKTTKRNECDGGGAIQSQKKIHKKRRSLASRPSITRHGWLQEADEEDLLGRIPAERRPPEATFPIIINHNGNPLKNCNVVTRHINEL